RTYDINTGALKSLIGTNYTGTNPSSNYTGNLAFLGNTLFTTGFDFSQGNQGAILRYDGLTGAPLPSPGNSGPVFVATNSNLLRPIGIAIYDIPEPATVAALLIFGGIGIAARKRQ
ncbi:MAG: PEP-CTERM sorting domain-containing protein, partial [Leptolyngbyaceae cyanobacterium bins.59]|nr:PEP-CTERM sorting domain-containing protein [Leptolyngbyaceae cyanobacterium bins.59]